MDDPVAELKGVGDATVKLLSKLGIVTSKDLLEYYPRAYQDYSVVVPINRIRPGTVCLRAKISSIKGRYVRRGMHVTEAVASDATGSVRLVWFNQPYRENGTKRNEEYFIVGEFGFSGRNLSITSPQLELVSDLPINSARIVPVYRETKGLTSKQLRKYIHEALGNVQIDETLPKKVIVHNRLLNRSAALRCMHFPETIDDVNAAKRRLGFEEIYTLALASMFNKQELLGQHALSVPFVETLAKNFVTSLGFTLTDAQRKVVWQIYMDMERDMPMNRLVEGDVGSGKTVVAAMAAVMAMAQKFQVVLMAPTEILARQHAETLHQLLQPLGFAESIGLLIGATTKKIKKELKMRIKNGDVRFVIGTHALIQDDVDMHSLALIIIDEQHRFGVEQRKALQSKAGHMPHVLSLTATPIPRSLALTVYGEMDISVIDTLPLGRKQIKTELVSPNSVAQLYDKVRSQVTEGRQVFWICPLISESSSLQAKAAEKMHEHLAKGVFKDLRVALLHGRMKSSEKEQIMQQFIEHKVDILVSTTVIEVGVNVPNATVMVIESADRFGLAQLHQLRGRVGRGEHQSYCFLVLSDSKAPSKRLRYITQTTDGFKLAEYDLELRGPGAIYGTSQHGALDLRVAQLTDTKLIAAARAAAREFLDSGEDLIQYSELNESVSKARSITNLN